MTAANHRIRPSWLYSVFAAYADRSKDATSDAPFANVPAPCSECEQLLIAILSEADHLLTTEINRPNRNGAVFVSDMSVEYAASILRSQYSEKWTITRLADQDRTSSRTGQQPAAGG